MKLNARQEQLVDYWQAIKSDREVLQLFARGQLSSVSRSRLQAVLRGHDAITNKINDSGLFDYLESVDEAADEDIVNVSADRNNDSTDSIIDRWAKQELIHEP